MDDLRTQDTLDALADLFLTGTTPPVRKPPGSGGPTAPMRTPPRKVMEDDAPAMTLEPKVMVNNDSLNTKSTAPAGTNASAPVNPLAHELEGPGPISIGARQTSGAHYAEHADDDASYHEEPSHLRLHDDEREEDRTPQSAHLEAVILGNLPGFGGPWLTQYAYHLAQQRGPVAIIHMVGDHADLELVTAQRQTIRPGIDEPLPPGSSAEALIARMQRMFSDRAQPVATWLIHLPSPTDAAQLAKAATIPHWTILCGGDDMAVAGATRMLQNMQQNAGENSHVARLVGVMIMGSDEPKAREAISKFNAAASSFLRQPIELIGSRKQMTPVHMRPLGGANGEAVWPAIHAFLSGLPTSDRDEPAAPAQATIETPRAASHAEPVTEQPVIERKPAVIESANSALLEPEEVEQLTQFKPAPPRRPFAASQQQPAPAPSTSPRSPQPQRYESRPAAEPAPSSINEPDLVALLTGSLAGSIALEARYPKQTDTQLILDQAGQLHLLRRQLGSDLKAALVDLIEARDWVVEHLQLIALTQRQCQFDLSAQPTLHLFTSDAKNAVAMVNKLGPFVKLHLLQEVRIGSAKTWVCTDLN